MSFLSNAAIAAALAAILAGTPALASAPPVGDPRVLVHLDQATGQQPENIALEPDGSADLTFAYTGEIARVDLTGRVRIVGRIPVPGDGDVPGDHHKIFLGGIVRAPDGALYVTVSTGTAGGTGVYRVRPGTAPVRIAALPADGFLNGMAADWRTGRLYVADSAHPVIWSMPAGGGAPAEWATGDVLTPAGGFGANGVKVHGGAVWVSNIGAGTLIRIPIGRTGTSGAPSVVAKDLGPVDDFAFTGGGRTVLAAVNQENKVVMIDRSGRAEDVLTSADGLDNPTAVAVRGKDVYVTDGAYFGGGDPNLLIASLRD
ncbi:hypothetical protein GCM10027176_61060 [Actinoallomurus bryophytorum]|uniref:Sugar lactone lactonase YvrE n=1 Tax=Actinoallomurus bryophytorum TaxID=1490222 RepID=A0A543CP70_9ACTN|nr:hypothetical protein [Actinoallomurus bryophytorum]TQL98902.1 hypothetical protein FB559_4550 [Actinoallomurus bryophytorum]